MRKQIPAPLRLPFLLFIFCFLLFGCVPSPTATPPRQTPFPTLPFVEGTATPELGATNAPGTPLAPAQTRAPIQVATAVSIPTNSALIVDSLAPLVQVTIQDPELPVSLGQTVPLNVLAADDNSIARLELYDNDVLSAQVGAITPSPVYSNQFLWKANSLGKHNLRAVAYDVSGNASAAAQIDLNVINNNRAPTIMITFPSGNKDAELGAPIMIQGVATDDVAVTRMELRVDNQLVTFVTPEQAEGVTPFSVAIPWTPKTTGPHSLVLRAYDNQNQSDDSLPYTIRVFDNQAPVVTAQSEYTTIALGEVLVVNALALANNGVARLELFVDEHLVDAKNSSAPLQQTSFQATLTAPDLTSGAHTFFVRAHDVKGQTTDTARTTINVQEGAPRILHETRAEETTRTPLPPTATATPQINLPGPPTIELTLLNAPVILPNTAKIQLVARGSSELDRVELWARAPGEPSAQLVAEENVQGATDKTLTYDWSAPRAGVVEMSARVMDNLNQASDSAPLIFSVQAPPAPTPEPAIFNFVQTWYAESPAARYEATFAQFGRALRGTFLERRADGKIFNGSIVSGAVNEKNVLFAVDFSGDASASQHQLLFECGFNARPPVLTCNYANENNERGSAVFQPLAP